MANGFFDDEYLEKLRRRFTRKLNHDTIAQKYQWQILNGTATFEEAEKYAARAGEILADVLQDGITKDILPDGVLTEETAEKILGTMLREDHELVTEASAKVMEDLNRAAGMQMNAIRPPVETDRITGLAEKAASYADLEDALWLFRDPVINFSQHTTDRLIEENVDAHYKAGLSPRITRKAVGGCCKWCSSLSGKYDYPVDREVYRRHENCRCLVLYDPGDGKVQNAHTKKIYEDAQAAEREHRIELAEKQSGAKKSVEQENTRRENHAARYYEEVRNRAPYSDAKKIAKNVKEFDAEQIEEIRQHMFIREQPRDGGILRFNPDYDQAEVWQRLIDGKNMWESDVIMLRHEYMELTIMRETGCTYEKAHEQANKIYNWYAALLKEKKRKGKL